VKIVVKHYETQIEVSDNNAQDDGRGLLYHNQTYTLQLLEKIVAEIYKLNEGGKQ